MVADAAAYDVIKPPHGGLIKAWTRGVAFEDTARRQVENVASLPIVYRWVAVMPDVHAGIGATIGSVIPTIGAVIPAAVGVDIGCGLIAQRTSLTASDLPESLQKLRSTIEATVPHGRTKAGRDKGAWHHPPPETLAAWQTLAPGFQRLREAHPVLERTNNLSHLGTLGTGNHFVELCLDEDGRVWVMLHSGSRGVGNRIGTYFIELARKDMGHLVKNLPDKDLAYLREGTRHFDEYVAAVGWAQEFARLNREVMMRRTLDALRGAKGVPPFTLDEAAVNCHHNYVAKETHFGKDVLVTRKGAVRARRGDLGIIPGSMGAQSFIVRGKGNPESFDSCSHGAGRLFSRTAARERFSLADHAKATAGVECRKDAAVLDETPAAYKPIADVMAAQADLVDVVHTLRQIVCVKG